MLTDWLPPVLIAPVIGSFLGVLVRRLPAGGAVAWDRSRCEACGHVLGPADMVPLASYVLQRGKCRYCRAPIDRFHPAIELAALAVAAWAATLDEGARLWADCVLGWTLLALTWIDAEHMILPDVLTLPLVLLGLGWTGFAEPGALFDHALGAAAGWLLFATVSLAYRRLRGRDGLGEGTRSCWRRRAPGSAGSSSALSCCSRRWRGWRWRLSRRSAAGGSARRAPSRSARASRSRPGWPSSISREPGSARDGRYRGRSPR